MIWATVSSQFCFCWLYKTSPSLAAKNIINLISVLTMWCPCVESSLVLLEEGVYYDQCVLLGKLYYPLPCFILYSKAKLFCYSRYLLTSHFCIPVPYDQKSVQLLATPWTVAHQAPLLMGFSRQEYWSGLPFPSPGDLPNPGIEPGSPALQVDTLSSEPPGKPIKNIVNLILLFTM